MDISQAGDFLRNLANRVGGIQSKAALAAASDGLALIKERVISSGENAEGSKFKDYSDVGLPTFFIKSRTGSDKLKNKIEKKASKASYKDIREAAGLQTEHRDFKFTGRMWANIHPKLSEIKEGHIKVSINAIDPSEQQKVKWNIQESGNFLRPNKEELKLITESYNEYFIKEFTK